MPVPTMLLFFAIAVCGAVEQPSVVTAPQSAEVLSSDADEIVITRGPTSWRVNLTRLVRNIDCAWPYLNNEHVCAGRAAAPCPECPRHSCIIGWDVRHERLYFGISTGSSKNNVWTIFSYSLKTRRVARFTNTWAAIPEKGAVSRSGRYLAYVNYDHGGMCADSSLIEVVDLWEHRVARPNLAPANKEDVMLIDGLVWTSPSSLKCEARVHSYPECRMGKMTERPIRSSVDVATLTFQ